MDWQITGGCGFIGRNLVAALMAEGGHRIRVYDNLSVGRQGDLAQVADVVRCSPHDAARRPVGRREVLLVEADILSEADLGNAARGAQVLVHLAANTGVAPSVDNPRMDCVTNVLGVLNALEAARTHAVSRFVFASSGAPLGACSPPIHENLAPHPASPYGASKLAGEGYCSAYYHSFSVQTIALRFGNVYGPRSGHKSSVVARFLQQALQGETLEVFGDGDQTRDFIYIDDLTAAIQLAARAEQVGGETFQIATNRETTINELVELLRRTFVEQGLAEPRIVHQAPRVGDAARNYSDISKARRLLGWSPRVELDEGLKRTLLWYQIHQEATRRAA